MHGFISKSERSSRLLKMTFEVVLPGRLTLENGL